MRALPLLLIALVALIALPACSRSVTLTNATEAPVRASLERELIGAGNRTLDAATILPDATVKLGPVSIYTERVTLIVQPASTLMGAVPLKERLGFGSSEFTIVSDEFAPATLRLAPGPPEDSGLRPESPE